MKKNRKDNRTSKKRDENDFRKFLENLGAEIEIIIRATLYDGRTFSITKKNGEVFIKVGDDINVPLKVFNFKIIDKSPNGFPCKKLEFKHIES